MIESPSLLITDDDPAFRETLQGVFEPEGYRTLLAGADNGDQYIFNIGGSSWRWLLSAHSLACLVHRARGARIVDNDADRLAALGTLC